MRSDSGRPQHPTAKETAARVARGKVSETGRDIGDGDHAVKPPRQGFSPYPGANAPGGTAADQKTAGAQHAGGSKRGAQAQDAADGRGSAAASGRPGHGGQPPGRQS